MYVCVCVRTLAGVFYEGALCFAHARKECVRGILVLDTGEANIEAFGSAAIMMVKMMPCCMLHVALQ